MPSSNGDCQLVCSWPEAEMVPKPSPALSQQHYSPRKLSAALWAQEAVMSVQPMRMAKIILLGNSGVGKTSLLYSYKYGPDVMPCTATIGASFVYCEMSSKQADEDPVQLQLWDTAGQERYRSILPMYLRNASGAILVYDITDKKSFLEVGKWLQDLEDRAMAKPVLVLAGTKADLVEDRAVGRPEGEALAHKIGALFFELSAFDPNAIDDMLLQVSCEIRKKKMEPLKAEQVELVRVQPWKRCSPPHSPTSSGQMSPSSSEELILSSNASSLYNEQFSRPSSIGVPEVDDVDEVKSKSPCCAVM